MGNVGMVERAEDAPLVQKPRERPRFTHASTAQHLERDTLAHSALLAFGQPDLAHAAFADALYQAVTGRGLRVQAGVREYRVPLGLHAKLQCAQFIV